MMHCGILILHKRAITLLLWHQQWLVGDAPFPLKSALRVTHPLRKTPNLTDFRNNFHLNNVSTIRDSEKSSIMTGIKSTVGFPTSYRWSAYVTPKSPKHGWNSNFLFFFNKSQLQSNKVCYKVFCVKTFGSKVVVQPLPYLMVHRC